MIESASRRAAGWLALNGALSQALSLVVFLITARFVSPNEFGVMAFCFVSIECIRATITESIGLAVTAMDRVSDEDLSAAFWLSAAASLLAAVLLFLSAPRIADVFCNPELTYALRLTSLIVLTNGLTRIHEAWLARQMLFKIFAIRSSIAILCGGSVGVAMALAGRGIDALIGQQLTTAAIGAAVIWGGTRWRPLLRVRYSSFVRIVRGCGSIVMTQTLNVANAQSDTFFLSFFVGASSTGAYNAARRLIFALTAVTSTGRASLPAFAQVQEDNAKLAESFISTLSFTAFFTAPIYLGLAATAPETIAIILGDRWSDSADILSVLAVLAYVTSLSQHAVNVVMVRSKSHWLSMIIPLDAAANIALFTVVAPYGAFWVATAYVARGVAFAPIVFMLATRLCAIPITRVARCLLPATTAAFVMAAVVLAIPHAISTYFTLIAKVAAGLVVYASVMAVADWTTTKGSVAKAATFLKKRRRSG